MKRAYKHIESGNVQILSDLTVEILSSEKIAGKNVWQPVEMTEEGIEEGIESIKVTPPSLFDLPETPRVKEIKPFTELKNDSRKAISSKDLD